MLLSQRINAFIRLGQFLIQFRTEKAIKNEDLANLNQHFFDRFLHCIETAQNSNGWFTSDSVRSSIAGIAEFLCEEKLHEWLSAYPAANFSKPAKRVGVVMAGNIPMVGFHDFLCVLISGNSFVGKLSSKDDKLMKQVIQVLQAIEPKFTELIELSESAFKNIDAIIATGSNNSARYFDYYFAKYPHIIRRNRNSVAILTGKETSEDLKNLGQDIFMYYGLGCRNVSKLYVPENYDFTHFFESIECFANVANHHKYFNNYEYNKAIYLINLSPFLDNGFVLLRQEAKLSSSIAVLHYETYTNISQLELKIQAEINEIQCIAANCETSLSVVPFGTAQNPQLWDYADNLDTINFLINLK
jgi:hypothetical protein